LPRGPSFVNPALSRSEANKGFEQVGGSGGTLDKFAGAGAHGADDDLRLAEAADGEDGGVGQFLAKKFDGAHGHGMVVGGDIDEKNIRTGGLHAAHDGVGGGNGEGGAGVDGAGHTGAIDQHLEHGALFIVGGHDDDREFGHKRVLLLN